MWSCSIPQIRQIKDSVIDPARQSSSPEPLLSSDLKDGQWEVTASGTWTVAHVSALTPLIDDIGQRASSGRLNVDMGGVDGIDTFGACLLDQMTQRAKARGQTVTVGGLSPSSRALFDAVDHANSIRPATAQTRRQRGGIDAMARAMVDLGRDLGLFLAMLGAIGAALGRVVVHPKSFRLTSVVHQLDRVGYQAIPVVLLITFLMGAIIAQQGIFHFRKFGAESYVVDLVGILVLRELGVLLVATVVAGRSGSSYAAELGSMKMREEIDALRTMGLDPVEVLILPRVAALILGLPALTFLGSIAALAGGGVTAWLYGGMSPAIFLARLRDAISITHFEVGMLKAPFMALVIGVVACAEGLQVKGSAESLGLQTTASVVNSIFLVIVLDGLFAVFFASIGM